ncbi:MAG: hypothetical protein ACXVPC_09435 [Tumebacillaceae bacterium]
MVIDNKVETNGATLRNIYEGCGVFQTQVVRLLRNYDIYEIKMDNWYPLQVVLDIFQELAVSVGPNIITEIGKQVPNNSLFPPIGNFENALLSLDFAYKENHRNGRIGKYEAIRINKYEYRMNCDNPYPAKFNLGLLRGLSRKHATLAKIEQLDSEVRGGAFLIKW